MKILTVLITIYLLIATTCSEKNFPDENFDNTEQTSSSGKIDGNKRLIENREGVGIEEKQESAKINIIDINLTKSMQTVIKFGDKSENATTTNPISRLNRIKRNLKPVKNRIGRYGGYADYNGAYAYSSYNGAYPGYNGAYSGYNGAYDGFRGPAQEISKNFNMQKFTGNPYGGHTNQNYGMGNHGIGSNTRIPSANRKLRGGIGIGLLGKFKRVPVQFCKENDSREICISEHDRKIKEAEQMKVEKSIKEEESKKEEESESMDNRKNSLLKLSKLRTKKIKYINKEKPSGDDQSKVEVSHDNCTCKDHEENHKEKLERKIITLKPENFSHQEDEGRQEDEESANKGREKNRALAKERVHPYRLVAPEAGSEVKRTENLTTDTKDDAFVNITTRLPLENQ